MKHQSESNNRMGGWIFCFKYSSKFLKLEAIAVLIMADDCKMKRILYFTSVFLQFIIRITAYKAEDDIVLNCGSSGNSTNGDSRTWIGDIDSRSFPFQFLHNGESVPLRAETRSPSVANVPYVTARLSHSEFTYFFPLTPGQKFIRLYFYAASYSGFDRSKAVFSVRAGGYTLLRDFNVSVNADASGSDQISREFCMYVKGNDDKLNITFTPTNQDSYAFVSGIEIVSMPVNLYYTPPKLPNDPGVRGLKFIGQDNRFFPIENYTALEMVYRINIGGTFISSAEDTGMFRTWSEKDLSYFYGVKEDVRPVNTTLPLNFSKIPEYTAPENVYKTARTMGPNATINKSYNLTWGYPVDPGFHYMLRLHFCEFEGPISAPGERVFLIYIRDLIAEESADVIRWAGGKGIPIFRDYIVSVSRNNTEKKVNLSVNLQANPEDWKTAWSNLILNGIEIFKLNDSSGNLAGQNPDSPPTTTQSLTPSLIIEPNDSRNRRIAIVISSVVVGGVVFCMVVMLMLRLFIFKRRRRCKDQTPSKGTSRWALFSFSTNKSRKKRRSTLPSDLCRCFSLSEIKAATKDFDDVFIIGVGGFGNVYKGYIDNEATQVAIKRLKPGSKQGAREFKTEIEMLSQLRHIHLVSLIGYCNDDNEMILVYDYMSRGTLRSHIYDRDGDKPSHLPWKQRLRICIDAAKGLDYLHTGLKYTIIHRDIKTTNILLDEKWVTKVSDFGLSKMGPTGMSKAHVSTVVKGSFGYLDPEYYRRQKLTEKSDVYSFGVVLCEVLCGRPAVIRSEDTRQNNLAEWVRRCRKQHTMAQIIDTNIKNEIAHECFKRFMEIVMSCIQEEGSQRPSMNDVVKGLEFVLQLQEGSKEAENFFGGGDDLSEMKNGEEWLFSDTFSQKLSNSETNSEGSSFTSR